MRNFIQDLRYAVRTMAKRPGFTIVAALTLALGIGANTAIFSAVNAVLLKPLPFPESQQLIFLFETFKPDGFGSVSVPNFEDWKQQNTMFAGLSAFSSASFNLEGGDPPQRIPGLRVSSNYFDVLSVKPTVGRGFLPGEDIAGSERVVVISDELWRRNFAANPRATVRRREISIRIALGAGRRRLIQQFLTEGLVLSIIGGGLGIALAWWTIKMLGQIVFPFVPRSQEIRIDSRVLLFTFAVSILTSIVFGLIPSLQAGKTDVQETLKEGGNTMSAGVVGGWLRPMLVVVEVAAAVVLLIGAGLMIRSILRIREVEPGLKPQNLLTAKVTLPRDKYQDAEAAIRFYQQVLERVSNLPGVESAGLTSHLPIEERGYNGNIAVEGKTYPPNESPIVEFRAVNEDYFQAANIPLLRGRTFSKQERDDVKPLVVINETMAKQIWPGEDPIGKRLADETQATVIGVVGDVKNYGLLRNTVAEMYAPYTLKNFWPDMRWNMRFLVRSTLDDSSLAAAVRREVQAVDPGQPLYGVQTMNLVIENTVRDKSVNTTLLTVFAGVSLLLAVIGVYGVMSYTAAQHVREIGIRIALGAQPRAILKLVVGRGLMLVTIGAAIGVLASFGLTRFIEGMLFGVTPTDPLTFVAIVALLGFVALLACLIPAQRAMRVDPIVVLRHQ